MNHTLGVRIARIGLPLLVALAISASGAQAASYTIDQTGTSVAGWFVGNDPDPSNTGALTATFETGPGSPPAGLGSLEVNITGSGYSKFWVARDDYQGVALSLFTSFTYATYYDSASTGTNATWYVNLYVDTTGDGVRDVRLDFAPSGLVDDTWQTWDLLTDPYWHASGPSSPALTWTQILTTYSTGVVAAEPFAGNTTYPSLVFNMGDSAGNYQGIITNIDNITIGVGSGGDDWDFEPILPNLTAAKSNNVGGATTPGGAWNWTVAIDNPGSDDAVFDDGEPILRDYLPTSGLTYGTVTASGGATGTVLCTLDGGFVLTCSADGTVTIPAGSDLNLTIPVTANAAGVYSNPRTGSGGPVCVVDPDSNVTENNEADNNCVPNPDTVTVTAAPVSCPLANCSFESPDGANQLPTSWKLRGVKLPGDGTDTSTFADGDQSFRFFNPKAKSKKLWQVVAINGPKGTNLALTFRWRGENVAGKKGLFRVMAILYYTKGGSSKFYVNMPIDTHNWTLYTLPFTAKKDFKKLRVEINFGKQGTAWFDNFGLTMN